MYNKVTISGLICTGKTSLFWALQEKLKWPTFSASQFFRDYARTYKVSLEKAEEQSEELSKKVDFQTRKLLQKNGNLIAEGWMSGIMADQFPDVLRILLTCKDEVRISRFAKREGLSFKEAEKRIKAREKNLFTALEKIYHRRDFVDPKNYNCLIATSGLSQKELVRIVLEKLKGKTA